ncbi:hypothetical protein EMPS_07740 [Entomortierella parvispora]|uniref:Uncharacterized protein n=1 Tax=Entomortierella parvispora TaxID=205924 RepID=A0A9P3LYQ5_9FUNG|nr:hypothetical protein EMPS_07740 [Entomortierella parvispora]
MPATWLISVAQGTTSQAQGCATKIVRTAIDQHTHDTINTLAGNEDGDSVQTVVQSLGISNSATTAAWTSSSNRTTTSTTAGSTDTTQTGFSSKRSDEIPGDDNLPIGNRTFLTSLEKSMTFSRSSPTKRKNAFQTRPEDHEEDVTKKKPHAKMTPRVHSKPSAASRKPLAQSHSESEEEEYEDEEDITEELAMVASCTPFAHLVSILYSKYGYTLPSGLDPHVSFPTDTTKYLYDFAKNALDNWHTCSKIDQKNCLVALSGIVNSMDPHFSTSSEVVSLCLDKNFFTVSPQQKAIFRQLKRKLGLGTMKELRALRRHCSHRRNELEESYDNDGWTTDEEDDKKEEFKIMQMMEFICEEIISRERISKTSEHEDVFVWRGLARILYEHDLVVRVGELGSSSTREDRTVVEKEFGKTDSNVRGRKIDILHQLCVQGSNKPVEMVA